MGSRCSSKKYVIQNFVNFTGKHLCWILCQNVADLQLLRLQYRCLPVKLAKYLQNTSGGCFCHFHHSCIYIYTYTREKKREKERERERERERKRWDEREIGTTFCLSNTVVFVTRQVIKNNEKFTFITTSLLYLY